MSIRKGDYVICAGEGMTVFFVAQTDNYSAILYTDNDTITKKQHGTESLSKLTRVNPQQIKRINTEEIDFITEKVMTRRSRLYLKE